MRPLVIQQSFPAPRPTTNPYIVMLADAIRSVPDVELRTFSWRSALLEHSDVVHLHWPEILVAGRTPLRSAARQALTLLWLAKLTATRTAIVRTAHNLELPDGISRRERGILRLIDRMTVLKIRLNESTEIDDRWAVATIQHGHYRGWFARYPLARRVPGRLAYFGLIRRYKGVDRLLDAFAGVPEPDASLHVAGRPSSPELAAGLRAQAAGDPRVTLALEFIPDEMIPQLVGEANLVVLPYREMHNSGGALTTLSLDRPVLLPANAVNQQLSDEVGAQWVHQYEGELTAAVLEQTLAALEAEPPQGRPNLSAREWDDAGLQHVEAYRRAIARRRGHSVAR